MKNYKIAVAGTGYVGLSLGVLFAQHHQVVAVDIVQAKVDMINNKKSPIQDVNPKELIKFNGFFTKLSNGEYLLLNEQGYQVEGQKGTWTVTDEKTIDEQRFVLMVNDQKPDLLPSIVVQSDGKFITSAASGFDNATVRKVRELLHHEKFLKNGTAERARESGTEQNYNMIDGCVNNVPKKPRVIGGRVSVLDRLHIKQAERARKDNAERCRCIFGSDGKAVAGSTVPLYG